VNTSLKNEEYTRLRIRDAVASTVMEELWGVQWIEFGFSPHDFAFFRQRGMHGFIQPDDPRAMHMGTFNRKHKYVEHYMLGRRGDMSHMTHDK
jgi:hypothetical protein